MRIFFNWSGHELSESDIDLMFLMSLGEYKIKNPEQELFKMCSNWMIIHNMIFQCIEDFTSFVKNKNKQAPLNTSGKTSLKLTTTKLKQEYTFPVFTEQMHS